MPTLILNRPDPKAKGSYQARKQLWRIEARLNKAKASGDEEKMLDAYDEMEDWLLQFATTDDGSDPKELIKELSVEEFDSTIAAFRGESVPLPNAAPSTAGSTDAATLPSGPSST
jgi:hypothetical protein